MAAVLYFLLVLLTVCVATVLCQNKSLADLETQISELEQCVGRCRVGKLFITKWPSTSNI